MKSLKRLAGCIREYKLMAILAPTLVIGEVAMEVLIPYITAMLLDQGIEAGNISAMCYYIHAVWCFLR